MKKSVVLSIVVIYVLSIVAVGLLGMKLAVYDETRYVTAIKLVDSPDGDYKVSTTSSQPDTDFIILTYSEGLRFQIYYEIEPLNATNESVKFDFDLSGYEDSIEISESGIVTVKQNKTFTVDGEIRSQDGSKVTSRIIRIYIRQNPDL